MHRSRARLGHLAPPVVATDLPKAQNVGVEDVVVMRSPRLWPQFPYLRVERRRDLRPGSPFCFVRAQSEAEPEPLVLMGPEWPPEIDLELDETYRLSYDSIEDVAEAGWRVVYLF